MISLNKVKVLSNKNSLVFILVLLFLLLIIQLLLILLLLILILLLGILLLLIFLLLIRIDILRLVILRLLVRASALLSRSLLVTLSYLPHLLFNALKLIEDLTHLLVVLCLYLIGKSDAQLIHDRFTLNSDLV